MWEWTFAFPFNEGLGSGAGSLEHRNRFEVQLEPPPPFERNADKRLLDFVVQRFLTIAVKKIPISNFPHFV